MRWPAWTSHLLEKAAVNPRSAQWDSGPTSLPVCSNCPASQPCTRKCWAEVRERGGRNMKAVTRLWSETSKRRNSEVEGISVA